MSLVTGSEQDYSEPFHLSGIRLTNIRGFRELKLDLSTSEGPRRRTLIIGKNGTCKSTLLRALALGIAGSFQANQLLGEPLGSVLAREARQGNIWVGLFPAHKVGDVYLSPYHDLDIVREGEHEVAKALASSSRNLFVCGYGAGRFGTRTDSGQGYRVSAAVASLFRYDQALADPELTLRRLQSLFGTQIYDRTLLGLKRALGLGEEDEIAPRPGGGVVVTGPTVGGTIPLETWADGYRLTFSWLLDLYAWAMQAVAIDEDGQVRGILLIDEIEQHLHPSMQADILPRLSELFPKMQIFATTHSPLVALDATPEELIVLRREGDHVVVAPEVPDYLGYSVDDMLSDPRLFDSEVYGTETREKLSRFRELAAIPKAERDGEQRREIRSLAQEMRAFESLPEQENETSRLLKELMAKYDL
ncbi:MAG TPA: AAA family ATPase [Thermoanaerobaculia bacterium]|nr:AAA family ATPase [Thermoanaerobaculia bacterium]